MNWTRFVTYGDSYQEAFETLCNQLFERYLRRTYKKDLIKFRVINGAGGDGGIEAYGELSNGEIIAVQAKWFRQVLKENEIGQIRKSISTALSLRTNIKEYIICIPHAVSSTKFGRGAKGNGKKVVAKTEEKTVNDFTKEIETQYPNLKITWWFEQELELQLLEADNEGVQKFWFEKEILSFQHLVNQFQLQKNGWLYGRYIPELHSQGTIQQQVQQLLYHKLFRDQLHQRLQLAAAPFIAAQQLLSKFCTTLNDADPLKIELDDILQWLNADLHTINETGKAINSGSNNFMLPALHQRIVKRSILDTLASISATNMQIALKTRLIEALNKINSVKLNAAMAEIQRAAQQSGRLFVGDSGTGKTHGLSNTVELQLEELAPAIIIQAKGTSCSSWSVILSTALELTGWDKNQILSALETLAIRNNHRQTSRLIAGEESKEFTKVVICIDGMEEDTLHWSDWYERMRQSVLLMEQYPLVKFVFSARSYFLDLKNVPVSPSFEVIQLPREGDVSVFQVIDRYFSKEHFDITVDPISLIRGLDSLFALRLFCETYKGKSLTETDDIITAEKVLLNSKVSRLNKEFINSHISPRTAARTPVRDALSVIAECFYKSVTVEHNELFDLLQPTVGKYLNDGQIDQLIEYLSSNGLLIKNEIPDPIKMLGETKFIYQLPYQSIMELVMGDKFSSAIVSGELTQIPDFLLETPEYDETEEENEQEKTLAFVNKRIVQNTVSNLFYEYGKLIGVDGYLIEGLNARQIIDLQMNALIKAPKKSAEAFKEPIEQAFYEDYKRRFFVLRELIIPAASSAANYFGAEFLHTLLSQQPNAFAREQLWLGWDRYAVANLGKSASTGFFRYNLQRLINPNGEVQLHLQSHSLHNELPLIFGWSLATLDQPFRHNLRVALTEWALKQPIEFISLLKKLFDCNDPQIQEDLASITLGLATKLKDRDAIESLAKWTLENVFSDTEKNRNIIVRQGFRSIVERAHQYNLITDNQVANARPKVLNTIKLLPLDKEVLDDPHEEIYPIVHDLAWYVINKSYDDFLDYGYNDDPFSSNVELILKNGNTENKSEALSPYIWAMAAAFAYIKSLGFNRTDGSSSTQATHGGKSEIFTLEEKYTWLAVHYIQGYLADYFPLRDKDEFVQDYSEIVDIPNPAEFLPSSDLPSYKSVINEFVIQEHLTWELNDTQNFEQSIRLSVQSEPNLNFQHWIQFNASDFIKAGQEEKMLALFNYTSLHDSKEFVSSRIDLRACLVKKGQADIIKDLIINHPGRSSFANDIGSMHANPKTNIYSNPSDVVWMNWIGETESFETYYPNSSDEYYIHYSVTSVTNNTINGEHEVKIPSKMVRDFLNMIEMDGQVFLNNKSVVVSLIHEVKMDNNDRQEMVLVNEKEFLAEVDKNGYELVWFAELLSSKNPLNDAIRSNLHPMKCRKYFIYLENGVFQTTKYWDARFSNKRNPFE